MAGLITEFLGEGLTVSRPATPDIPSGAIAFWYSTDSNEMSAYADGAWLEDVFAGGGAGLVDGDYGDITVSGTGTAMSIDNGAVTLAKQANMATASVVYRKTAGSGAPEVQTLATLKTDLGLTGTNSGDQTIKTPILFRPYDAELPASNYAQIDTRNNHTVLAFDQTTVETVYFTGVLPNTYAGGGLTVDIDWVAVPTSGNVAWNVAIEAISGQDIDSDGFASDNAVAGVAVNGTSGIKSRSTATISNGANMDSLAAGDPFRLRLKRDTSTGSNAAGDAQVLIVSVRET